MRHIRPFPFRVRPRHLETVDSLTRRVLAANGEPGTLPQRLLSEHGLGSAEWPALLHAMNRSTPQLIVPTLPTHRDGSTCFQCTDLLTKRWMCTLCAHGDAIEQEPHFGTPVCARHHRWVGFGDAPTAQRPVPSVTVDAGASFTKLVKRHRLDARLYALVSDAVSTAQGCDEATAFPLVISIISAVTSAGFLRDVLSPGTAFRDAHQALGRAISDALGTESPAVTRTLWLAMRPAFAAAHAISQGQPSQTHPHDFPTPAALFSSAATGAKAEAFGAFLLQTGDTAQSAAQHLRDTHARLDPASRLRYIICAHGHEYTTRNANVACPQCPRGGAARYGSNDITTVAPQLVAEWDDDANAGVTPAMVPASSHRKYHWRCTAQNHPYMASPSNRTQTGADCPVCLNRTIVPGMNDFATRFPKAFAELHPSDAHQYNPHRNTPRSGKLARWVCDDGHTFKARFIERANGLSCPQCRRVRAVTERGSLADTHPALAREWVSGSDSRTPADFSSGSRYLATWRCAEGHDYSARIERRVNGTGCPYCSRRRLLQGFNDLATTHPQLAWEWDSQHNDVAPTDVLAGSIAKRRWRCRNGHETTQSIPHRITSGGCTSCAPAERALRSTCAPEPWEPSAAPPVAECASEEPAGPPPEVSDLADMIQRIYSPDGFTNDTIVDSWAEAAGLTDAHPEPGMLLRHILAATPNLTGRDVPPLHDLLEVIDALTSSYSVLPQRLLLARATCAALTVVQTVDGPFETEQEFATTLATVTRG